MIDLDDLERKAKAATPGEWGIYVCDKIPRYGRTKDDACGITAEGRCIIADGADDECHHIVGARDAAFIAAANPAAVLELIAEVRRLRLEASRVGP